MKCVQPDKCIYVVLGYYRLCNEGPCGEHGTCELSEDEQSYVCQCEEGHVGEHCESKSEFLQTFTFLININLFNIKVCALSDICSQFFFLWILISCDDEERNGAGLAKCQKKWFKLGFEGSLIRRKSSNLFSRHSLFLLVRYLILVA